jgi:hypothetical protein
MANIASIANEKVANRLIMARVLAAKAERKRAKRCAFYPRVMQ